MARGLPAVWSAVVGIPFVGVGGWLSLGRTEHPPEAGLPFAVFGLFVVGLGAYVHFLAAPEEPRMRDGERVVATRHPTQRVALVEVGLGLPFLAATVYLLYFTFLPYVYPTATLVVGLGLLSTGLLTYWRNSLTTYYVTTDRVLEEYRFLALVRREVPLEKVRGVQERRSLVETVVGLGNVRVASGDGRSLRIVMRNVEDSGAFADEVRELL